jgi:hypothetical protein
LKQMIERILAHPDHSNSTISFVHIRVCCCYTCLGCVHSKVKLIVLMTSSFTLLVCK